MYSLTFVILAQVVPMDKLGICTGILSSVFALASLLGPILGGVISDQSTWRVGLFDSSQLKRHANCTGYLVDFLAEVSFFI